ncbi:MAG: SDR family NAD(P)-dependent oxidoreductase [Desulfobacterales bacterium]|nr:SDR family NAD(P)-dependent oxidoreductase [Desulfobacterales bacterium]
MTDRAPKAEMACDIAIIGMAGFFPDAPDVGTYWHNILRRHVAFSEIPAQRWDWRLYYDADPQAADKVVSRWGGFLPDAVFDPMHFGIPPKTLTSVETVQLLVLESTRLALADAGYQERPFDRERTSVFIGAGAGENDLGQMFSFRALMPHYFGSSAAEILSRMKPAVPEWDPDVFTGVITNIIAGRVANRFNLGGTSCTIDAACASALAALRAGIMELRSGESDLAIVGGADTLMGPFAYNCFSVVGALSPKGVSRPFDEQADGLVLGETVATVILKRLADARRDGDRVYAVIKGIGSSSDGRAKSLTAPSTDGQRLALTRAYRNAGIDPRTVGLIEAHGTSTKVGDLAEAAALKQFFSQQAAEARSCAVGSVKSQIGHAKCAAGIAALIKAVLALHHKVLPPTVGVETPIADLDGPDNPLYLNTRTRPWIVDGRHPRRAGVSAFGFGGTNFHAVLEEAPAEAGGRPALSPVATWDTELLLFKADGREALTQKITALLRQLRAGAVCALKDLAFTLAGEYSSQKEDGVRLAVVAASLPDLADKLENAMALLASGASAAAGIYFEAGAPVAADQIAFVFPGQGSQYPGMLKSLAVAFAEVRAVFERFDAHLAEQLPKPLSRYIYPPDLFKTEERKSVERALTQTLVAQPAMGAADAAMLRLLALLGLRPAMAAGHSYGEYVALFAAGVLDERALALISEARGRFILQASQPEPGTMAAVKAPEEAVADVIADLEQVWIANLNGPRQTVISGTQAGVRQAIERLSRKKLSCVPIPVACAFHSPIVAGAQSRLAEFFGQFEFRPAHIPVFSNTTAGLFPEAAEAIRNLLVEQLARPVRFVDEVETMYAAGARIFVEVGAGSVLTHLIDQILDGKPHVAMCTDVKGQSALTQLQHCLGRLATLGAPLTLEPLFAGRGTRRLNLDRLTAQGSAVLSKTAYIIGQGGVRPAAQAARAHIQPPRPIRFADDGPATPGPQPQIAATPDAVNPQSFGGETMETFKPAPTVQAGLADVTVMVKFQELMSQFLETQKAVMTAYLGAGEGAVLDASRAAFPASPVLSPPAAQAEPLRPEPASAWGPTSVPEPVPAPPAPAPEQRFDLNAVLLKIVSDRTGYPSEMLDLKLEIEADLGIDSIKRVQITEELVASLDAAGIQLPNEELAAIAGSITLGAIVEKLQTLLQAHTIRTAAQPVTAPAAPSVQPPAPAPDVKALLLGIVSDLSGYPAEMLDLKLEIEADLGIDSIKRVQIMEHFLAALEKQQLTLPDAEVAQLAASVTLGEIVARIELLLSASATACAGPSNALEFRAEKRAVAPQPTAPADAPAGATVADALTPQALQGLLYELIQEYTGYPQETLSPDLEWEADLDLAPSAKSRLLTAFVSAVARACGAAPEANVDEALADRRVDQTLAWMAAARVAQELIEGKASEKIRRFTLVEREQPLMVPPAKPFSGKRVVVTQMPDDPLAAAVVAELKAAGIQPVRLVHGPAFRNGAEQAHGVDLTAYDQLKAILEEIRTEGAPSGLLHLVPLAPAPCMEEMQLADWKQRLALEIKSLFYLTKLLADDLTAAVQGGDASLVAVTAMGGAYGRVADAAQECAFFPGSGGVTGFLKSAALEIPGLNVRAVDLELGEALQTLAVRIRDEFLTASAQVEVGYRAGRRVVLDVQPAKIDAGQTPLLNIDAEWILLVTGGARGITAGVALELAQRYQPTLLLVGRTPLSEGEAPQTAGIDDPKQLKALLAQGLKAQNKNVKPVDVERACTRLIHQREVRRTLSQIAAAGAKVRYYAADVTDEAAFGQVLDGIYAEFGRIDGVLHGAGLIEDKMVRDKDVASFGRVLDTKADSLFILSRKLRADQLRFVGLFSSVAGRFGNIGQADYAAANEVLSKCALYFNRRWPGRVVSLMWGPWESQGMVSAELRRKFEDNGIYLIPPQIGVARCIEEIAHGAEGDAEVVFGGWDDRKRTLFPAKGAERLPLFFANANFKPRLDGQVDVLRYLAPERDIYLLDHKLDGRPVLPMAMAMEMMAEAAAYRYPDYYLKSVSDLKVFKGIIVGNGAEHIHIVITPQMKGRERIVLKAQIRNPHREQCVYYEARLELGKEARTFRPHVAIELREAEPFGLSVGEAYRQHLFHGPLWQGIEAVQAIGRDGIVGQLKPSRPEGFIQGVCGQHDWLVDPLVIDSGLQLVGLWARCRFNIMPLPSRIKKYVQYDQAPGDGPLRCEVHVGSPESKGIKEAELYFVKNDGQLFAWIQGLEIIGSTELNRLAQK